MDQRRMCPHCRAFITTKDRVCPYCNERVGPRAVEVRNPGAVFAIPHARFITTVILIINFGLYLATAIFSERAGLGGGFMAIDNQTLVEFGAKFRPAILAYGQWWRLVTAGFLHGGLLHIAMNSWVLYDVGAQVEEIYGGTRLIVIYFLSSVFGFVLSTFWSSAISVGASAGIMGLLGAMIALGVRHRGSAAGQALRSVYIRWVVYVLVIGLLPGLHIDNAAHIGGLAAGFGIAYLAGTPRIGGTGEMLWRGAAAACVVMTAASFLMMYLFFSTAAQ